VLVGGAGQTDQGADVVAHVAAFSLWQLARGCATLCLQTSSGVFFLEAFEAPAKLDSLLKGQLLAAFVLVALGLVAGAPPVDPPRGSRGRDLCAEVPYLLATAAYGFARLTKESLSQVGQLVKAQGELGAALVLQARLPSG
jgi:hypothetical protein